MNHLKRRTSSLLLPGLTLVLSATLGCSTAAMNGGSGDPGGDSGSGGARSGGSSGRGSGGSGTAGSSGGAPGSGGTTSVGGTGGDGNGGSGGAGGGDTDAAAESDAAGGSSDGSSNGGTNPPPVSGPAGPTDLAKHKYMRALKVDTTATGAGVMADVLGYPLAILLNAQNFNFAQAKAGGEDLRFSTAQGTFLPYAIEQWDATAKTAALWVLVDVKGNDNAQSIQMHWGNEAATSAADSKAVFSKAGGFLGVFHLDEDGNTTPGGYHDASWNEVHGTGAKLAAGTRVPARVGSGTRLDNPAGGAAGEIKWIEVAGPKVIKDFTSEEHPVSISAWVFANSWTGYYQTIFSKGDGSYSLQKDYMGRTEVCMSPATGTDHECAITAAPPTKMWTHYMVMRKNGPYGPNDLALYINGKRATGSNGSGRHIAETFGIGNQSFRGHERDKKGFDGIIDEVRVSAVERNADWAKLDFETQKEGSKVVGFGDVQTK
jgi:hypothetical protein